MIKEYRNNSNEYDALTMSRLCKQNHQSDSGVSIILYGNYFYNEDKKVGEYKKFFIHKGSLVHSDDSVFKYIGDSVSTNEWLCQEYDKEEKTFQYNGMEANYPKISEYFTNERLHYWVLSKEVLNVVDFKYEDDETYSKVLPLQFKKLRSIHFCKSCESHFKTTCQCLKKSNSRGNYSYKNIVFCDVQDKLDITSVNQSINERLMQNKTFLGFEWELGFTKNRYSTNDISLAFYRHIKNKDINLFNMFGDNMEDATISDHYRKGSEIGSNVFSFDFYNKYQTQIEEISEFANQSEIFGDKLGFHINISRDSFDNIKHLQSFLTLAYSSVEVLVKLSGRRDGGRNMQNYAQVQVPYGYTSNRFEKINRGLTSQRRIRKLAIDVFEGKSIGDKYCWFAFHKSHCIEYRLPSSSTDNVGDIFSKTCRHLELVFGLVEYSRHYNLRNMRFDKFLEYLSRNEVYTNIYNAIVSNENVMDLIEKATQFAKQINLQKPDLEVDEVDLDDKHLAKMEDDFKKFLKDAKSINDVDDETKNIKKTHNKKIKPRKKRGGK